MAANDRLQLNRIQLVNLADRSQWKLSRGSQAQIANESNSGPFGRFLTLKSPPFLKFDVISEPKLSGDGLSLFGCSGVRAFGAFAISLF